MSAAHTSQSDKRAAIWRRVGLGTVWALAIFGILRVEALAGSANQTICGPWGCGPPIEALIAWNGFWLLLLVPPAVFYSRHLPIVTIRKTVPLVFGVLLLAVIGYAGFEAGWWLLNASDANRKYATHRALFSVVTLVDVPLLPMLVASTCAAIVSRRRRTSCKSDHRVREDRNLPGETDGSGQFA